MPPAVASGRMSVLTTSQSDPLTPTFTLAVPLYALNQVSAPRCEWLVPGMLKEKAHLLLKSLPQKLRRHCVPLPDYAAAFCDRIHAAKKFGLGQLLGLELFAEGYSATSLVAIALVGLGGGMGLQAIRHLRGRSTPPGDAP